MFILWSRKRFFDRWQWSDNQLNEITNKNKGLTMLQEPRCFTRKCKHYTGVIQPDGTELTETNACKAFPKGIPDEIAYGTNLHRKPLPDQPNDIVYEIET